MLWRVRGGPHTLQVSRSEPISGTIRSFTLGLLGQGVLYDFWTLNGQVSEINPRRLVTW
jgi:hypothetical protein